jgi:hypothetical protein
MQFILACCLLLLHHVSAQITVKENIGFVGDFGGISLYRNEKQFETLDNSTHLILDIDGTYQTLATFEGVVTASCTSRNDIYFGGDFETVNNQSMHRITRYNVQSNTFSSLNQGLDGPVYALYCDTESVYVGGNFTLPVNVTGNYTGGVAEWSNDTWHYLPWHGFNGPIYTITKNQKTETILFGGKFDSTGDGMYFNSNTSQIIPLGSPTVSCLSSPLVFFLLFIYLFYFFLYKSFLYHRH